jgi:hypothetical protein
MQLSLIDIKRLATEVAKAEDASLHVLSPNALLTRAAARLDHSRVRQSLQFGLVIVDVEFL